MTILQHPSVLVFGEAFPDIRTIPTRPYDFNKGDRRFLDQQAAIEHAEKTARETGIRQIVRISGSTPGAHPEPFWLVQAVGS